MMNSSNNYDYKLMNSSNNYDYKLMNDDSSIFNLITRQSFVVVLNIIITLFLFIVVVFLFFLNDAKILFSQSYYYANKLKNN